MTSTETTAPHGASEPGRAGGAVPHFEMLIIGAGLSGIGAAYHFQDRFPHRSYAVLEARESLGGTWDLFRYPGIRSDSDMYTLGFRFRPWTGEKSIADGASILQYIRDTAAEFGIDRHIHYGLKVIRSEWSSAEQRWTVTAERAGTGETATFTADFVMTCSGYYRYDQGFTPDFPQLDRFGGTVVHPQHWPEDLDYQGKRVVIIGSGATAMTLAPSMAPDAAHVTVLQRTPTYVISLPGKDPIATRLRRWLPEGLAYRITRGKNVVTSTAMFELCQRYPRFMRSRIRAFQRRRLPNGYAIDTHFKPPYNPWDQRLCLVPNGDLFKAIRDETVSMVTDHVDHFTDSGIALRSGEELPADIVITATGLNLVAFGGMELVVDGETISLPETMAYKGMMLSGIPNFVYIVGYTNASWTLKADLVCEYVGRLLAHMEENGYATCVPARDPSVAEEPFLDFAAGYVLRSVESFPKQGDRTPWRLRMNYFRDLVTLRHGEVTDAMEFSRRRAVAAPAPEVEESRSA